MFDFHPFAAPIALIFVWFYVRHRKKIDELRDILHKFEKGESVILENYKFVSKSDIYKYCPNIKETKIYENMPKKEPKFDSTKTLLKQYKQSIIADLLKKRKFS